MKINTPAFAAACALVWAVFFSLCALTAAVAPGAHPLSLALLHNCGAAEMDGTLAWSGFFAGLAASTSAAALLAAALGWAYNLLNEPCGCASPGG